MVAIAARYKGYRYPIEVIGHAVWLYHRFGLSLRDVEELMLARGVVVTLVQSRRNTAAARRFFGKLLKGLRYVPPVIVTDKLASYRLAHRELVPSVTHRRSKYLNRAENSHQPTRVREPVM
ncbi:MAG TPA: DDE-type integrase/transposase/recombinase, partial [Mycobacterium sp.]